MMKEDIGVGITCFLALLRFSLVQSLFLWAHCVGFGTAESWCNSFFNFSKSLFGPNLIFTFYVHVAYRETLHNSFFIFPETA
jgi:hypothetical protein